MTLKEELQTKVRRWQKQLDNTDPNASVVQRARDETMQQMVAYLKALLDQH